jgi:hypothetical protein
MRLKSSQNLEHNLVPLFVLEKDAQLLYRRTATIMKRVMDTVADIQRKGMENQAGKLPWHTRGPFHAVAATGASIVKPTAATLRDSPQLTLSDAYPKPSLYPKPLLYMLFIDFTCIVDNGGFRCSDGFGYSLCCIH